jgi:parallel beta-helix repeat protein
LQKTASHLIIALLFLSLFTITLNTQTAKANPTIYIRADGTIQGTTNIQTANNITYTLTANLSNPIIIEKENITINGMNYTLQGTGDGTGINISGISNITIKNTNIKHFNYGVLLNSTSNNNINENNITANNLCDIYIYSSSNNSLNKNNITNSACGYWLESSSNTTVSENNISNNDVGIYLYDSSNNSITRNTFFNDGLVVNCQGNVVVDNLVNDKPLVYLENVSDSAVGDAGQVILVNCNLIRVENLSISHIDVGIELLLTNNSKISGNNMTANNYYGIRLFSSSNNTVIGNSITANDYCGIRLFSSSNNTVMGNDISANSNFGIYLNPSSDNNDIRGNDVRANKYGFWIESSSNNSVTGNRVKNNVCGICLYSSFSNKIYHNDFINNERQTFLSGSFYNSWDDGYPSGGNYWSDYAGVDLKNGPFQNETGSDGVGDISYIINENNIDNYSLMKPYLAVHDIGLSVSISKPVIFVGYDPITTIEVGIMNYGAYNESFNFTFEMGTTKEEQALTLESLNSTAITFTWNTTGLPEGNYTINAYAHPVVGETDVTDNNRTSSVFMTKVGDLGSRVSGTNVFFVCDGQVTSTDLQLFLQCYRETAPQEAMYLGDIGSRVQVDTGPPPVYANVFGVLDDRVDSTDLQLFLQCYRGQGPPAP